MRWARYGGGVTVLEATAVEEPVRDAERLLLLDVLRGLAVFGILVVNIQLYAHPFEFRFQGGLEAQSPAEGALTLLVRVLAEGKFYPLFSMLFGLGFALQQGRSERSGAPFGDIYVRRLLVLGGLGLAHGLLLWAGDILLLYALCGFILLALRKVSARALRWTALGCYGLPVLCCGLAGGLASLALRSGEAPPPGEGEFTFEKEIARAYQAYGGGFLEVAAQRLQDWIMLQSFSLLTLPTVLAMFLLGLLLGRSGLAAAPGAYRGALRWALGVGLAVGLPLNYAYARALDSEQIDVQFLAMSAALVGGPLLMLAYASALALCAAAARPLWGLRWIAPVGRMALTNYLAHSLVLTTLFYGYGFGLYGQLRLPALLALCCALFAAQVAWSHVWLAVHHHGPVEWLWRYATYGVRPPGRRAR